MKLFAARSVATDGKDGNAFEWNLRKKAFLKLEPVFETIAKKSLWIAVPVTVNII